MQDIINHITESVASLVQQFEIVWNEGVAGYEVQKILIVFAILIITLLVRRPIAWLLINWLKKITERFPNDWFDDAMVAALRGPIRLMPLWVGLFCAAEVFNFAPRTQVFVDHVILSLGTALLFWAVLRSVTPISRQFSRFEKAMTRSLISWLVKGIRFLVVLIAVAAILDIWGIEIGPILAGLGILGVAVALGAQDLFKNLIAGALILTEKRFDIGDWILVDGVVEGDVEKIGFRSTLIRRFDKAPVYVPNAKLSDDAVINFSRMTYRRIYWTIGLEYRTTQKQIDAVCDDIREFVMNDPDFVNPDAATVFVGLEKFNDSSVDILLVCFTDKIKFIDYAQIRARLGARVKQIVESHGTGFAFPSRTVYVEGIDANPNLAHAAAAAGGA